MSGIRGIFSNLASALQSRDETAQSSIRQFPATVPLNPTGADVAMHSMLERMSQTNAVAPSRAENMQASRQQGELREVSVDQVRAVMGQRWQARKPRIAPKMSPQRRETLMQRYQSTQARMDAKLTDYTKRLNDTMHEFNINAPAKQAAFLATVGIESAGLKQMTEGKGSRHISDPKGTGFYGRGIIQLTHEENYARASRELKLGDSPKYDLLVKNKELAASPEYAFKTAGWFWSARQHPYGIPNDKMGDQPRNDLRDFREASSLVNSGRPDGKVNGWGDRLIYYKRALGVLKVEVGKDFEKNLDEGIKTWSGRNLPAEPSYVEWRNEMRAKRNGGKHD